MSERVQSKLKQLTLTKRTQRERMQALIDCRMPSEGFTTDDFRELFSKHAALIVSLYQDFMQVADADATSKGKLLSTMEAGQVLHVLKDLMLYNAARIAHADWEVPFLIKELPCFLHQETHIIVRRQGVDALAMLVSIRAAAGASPSSTSSSGEQQQQQQDAPHQAGTSLIPLIHLMLSSLDWEFLRSTYGNVTTLPNIIIGDVRRGRHDCLPPRARYSSTSTGSDERLRETSVMLKRLLVDTLTEASDSPLATTQALALWSAYFLEHVAPLFAPNIALAAGLVHGATLHGFLSGVHPVVHAVLVDLVHQLSQREDLARSGRLLQTIGASSEGAKFVLGVLSEAVRNPAAEFATHTLRALGMYVACIRQVCAAPSTTALSTDSASPTTHVFARLPKIQDHLCWWLEDVLKQNTSQLVGPLLSLQATNCENAAPGGGGMFGVGTSSPLMVLGSLQALVEAYSEWLMLMSCCGSMLSALPSAAGGGGGVWSIPLHIRELAVSRLCVIVTELSFEALKKPSGHMDEVMPYSVQALWVSTVATIPLHSSRFVEIILPILSALEDQIAQHVTTSSSSHVTVPQASYLIRCWMSIVHHHVRVFVAPAQSKLVPFSWPAAANTQSITGTAAASSPLLEYRLKRSPVSTEWVTKVLSASVTTTSPAFTSTFEAYHSAMCHFEQDTYVTQQAKTAVTVDLLRTLLDYGRSWSGGGPDVAMSSSTATLPVEPDSLLKICVPYLLLQSRLTESSVPQSTAQSKQPQQKPSARTAPTTVWMSNAAKDALEALCEILSLATAERWWTPTAANPPPITPVLIVVAMDRLREVLHAVRSGLVRADYAINIPGRMLAALFRNATTDVLVGRPTSNLLCCTPLALPYQLLDELEASSLWVLENCGGIKCEADVPPWTSTPPGAPPPPTVATIESQTAALTALMWTLTVDRRPEAPLAPRVSQLVSALQCVFSSGMVNGGSAAPKQQRLFTLHLVKVLSFLVSMILRTTTTTAAAATPITAADRCRLQTAIVALMELLIAQYNVLDKSMGVHMHGAVHLIIETLEDRMKVPTWPHGDEVEAAVLSREFLYLLYRRLITALAGVALYHMHNWTRTHGVGDGLVQILYLLGELVTRVGHVHLLSFHPDDERRFAVPLAQLVADVVGMSQSGTSQCKYCVSFPGSALLQRRLVCVVSRVQSSYQLMQDALEAQSQGVTITAASTELYTQVMVPPLDASARQWFGTLTPAPTDIQADTLHPAQVVQAGAELYSALSCHLASFPQTAPSADMSIVDATTVVGPSPSAEHGAHFVVGRHQLISVDTEMLQGDVVNIRVASAVESSGWTARPAPHVLQPALNTAPPVVPATPAPTAITRQAGSLELTLERFLSGFQGTCNPPAELLEYCPTSAMELDREEGDDTAATVASGMTLRVPRKSTTDTLLAFRPAAPPTAERNAPVPRCDQNLAFSFLHSIGAVDGAEPLVQRAVSKFGSLVDDGSSLITLTKPAVFWDAVTPPAAFAPLVTQSFLNEHGPAATSGPVVAATTTIEDAVNELHLLPSRSLVPPLPCMVRRTSTAASSSHLALVQLQEAVYRGFGTVSDDGTSTRASTRRHELVLVDAPSLKHAFTRSDAVLLFVPHYADVLAATREIRQLLSGRSFVALFVVPSAVVQHCVTLHIARQGEGAPIFSPMMDGVCTSVASTSLLLRAALLSSTSPWRQPLSLAEARRRVSQRPTRKFCLENLETKMTVPIFVSNGAVTSVQQRSGKSSASPSPPIRGGALVPSSSVQSSPQQVASVSSSGSPHSNASFGGQQQNSASTRFGASPDTVTGDRAATVAQSAWELHLGSSGW